MTFRREKSTQPTQPNIGEDKLSLLRTKLQNSKRGVSHRFDCHSWKEPMRISEMNWMMVEEYLMRDDRCVLPLGSTEQHAYLSLSVDSILAERIAVEAAEPLSVPVFPVLAYGITPYFRAFPGSITLRVDTYLKMIADILTALW